MLEQYQWLSEQVYKRYNYELLQKYACYEEMIKGEKGGGRRQ